MVPPCNNGALAFASLDALDQVCYYKTCVNYSSEYLFNIQSRTAHDNRQVIVTTYSVTVLYRTDLHSWSCARKVIFS